MPANTINGQTADQVLGVNWSAFVGFHDPAAIHTERDRLKGLIDAAHNAAVAATNPNPNTGGGGGGNYGLDPDELDDDDHQPQQTTYQPTSSGSSNAPTNSSNETPASTS